jgi:uncharacterized repeat protein (TIGR01451 family)
MNPLASALRATVASCRSAVGTRLALVGVALLCCTGSAFAGGAVNIDGNLQDMIDYAGTVSSPSEGCSFVDQDPSKDIRIFDPKIIPCVPVVDNYYVNGFDQILDVLAYDRSVETLYLGMRVAGVIGDPDGNGNPDTRCPEATFDDETGIGFDDSYKWEINVDCAGAPEITIEVRNNQLTVTGATHGATSFDFNGSDLEVAVEGLELPPAYAVRVFAGNIADGLGEDLHELLCLPAGPEIIVDKSASPERICPGQNTTFTIIVTNPGPTPLQTVSLVDDLPANLTYVNGSSNSNCGVGQPSVVGQQITWPNFALDPGASCTITFQATAGEQCLGPQDNVATATGSFATACFQGGEPQVVQDSDNAIVTCAPLPCVDIITFSGPASACVDANVTLEGTVQNCSPEAETIVVSLVGGGSVNLGSVGAGQTVPFQLTGNMGQCAPGQNVTFTVNATATNECGEDTDQATTQVLCQGPPCVEITALNAPAEACQNTNVTISGTVQNCGDDSATYSVTLNGGEPQNLGVIAPGQSANFSFTANMGQCTAGQNVPFTVVATATNDCGTDTDTDTVNVICRVGPCVNITALDGPGSVCPNSPIQITGTVENCSPAAETIVVTLNGGSAQNLGSVPAGGTANFTFNTNSGECTAGQQLAFTVQATATNDCGEATDSEIENVRCNALPCVEITVMNAPESACANTNVTITGTVQNCSIDPETIVVVLNGGAPQNLGTVAGGATANFSFTVSMGACTAGQNVPFTAVATATNSCGTDDDTETRNVLCGNGPCVEVALDAPDNACVGEQIEVTANVTNCGPTANITVTVNGQNHNFGSVPAGGQVSHDFVFTVQNCVDGGVNYEATATATNECGTITDTDSERVACQTPSIDVEKTAESQVNDGDTIHYVITVTNNGPVALENIVVTDELCDYVRYADSAVPTPFSEPAVGSGGSVVWHIASLGVGQSVELRFNATADAAFGGGNCSEGPVTCVNHVVATGFCAGTGTAGEPARDEDDFPTNIVCPSDNCPRTVGYWGVQCRQMPNGSTKYTKAQMTQIAECADDLSSFFNWSAGTDFDRACAIINPTNPMNQRKQAKRQFMGTLFNLCVTSLDLDPLRGGKVSLDPNTPIDCDPFDADTIGELIDEVDDLLADLEGEDLNSAEVKAAYAAIISCFDGINNGTNIPVAQDCEDESSTNSELGDDLGAGGAGAAVELYRAFPNPFNATTAFAYEVGADAAQVDIAVYDVAGKLVRKVVSGVQAAGRHTATWDGRSDEGVRVIRGVYFVRTTIAGAKANLQRVIFVQ